MSPPGGSVTLNSSDPFAHPNVDFNVLSHPLDIIILREAIRSSRRLYSSPAFKSSVFDTVIPAANVTSDEDLDAYIRSVTAMFLHGVGSAAMSGPNASWGVVNPDFRVKGTSGLRIVDASIFVSCWFRFTPISPNLNFFYLPAVCAERAHTSPCVRNCRACERSDCTKVEVRRCKADRISSINKLW